MSVIFQTVSRSRKLFSFKKSLQASLSTCKCFSFRKYSDVPKKFLSFDEVVAQQRAEAKRSLVVQVNSESSFDELYGYCSKYATINGIHHYNNSSGDHFMLIEFASEDDLKDVLHTCSGHHADVNVMSLQSPFLWFRAVQGRREKLTVPKDKSLVVKEGNVQANEDVLFEELMKCGSVTEQIQLLYDRTVLNDVGVRLRYMVARQLEVVFQSLYSNIVVRPFGSSVNGFGRMGCDLDLSLTNVLTEEQTGGDKRLIYQSKSCEGGRWQRHMELVGELLELRVPGAARVTRILNARVPIVKYTHEYTDIECDLCYSNLSGVYMSELLWQLGSLDSRVGPLALAVRRWAQAAGLTSPHPGRWITNFPLTLMVIFFLQQRAGEGPVLPPVDQLVRRAEKRDIRIAEENLNCTFLRDLNKLPASEYGQSTATLDSLLLQFFEFYAQFDFQEQALSIIEGRAIRKPTGLPLYIVNPLERTLNVSRNVSFEECERIRTEVRNAAWHLDAVTDDRSEDWGLLTLIERRTTRGLKRLLRAGNSHRLVSVKDLFKEDGEAEVKMSDMRTRLDRLTSRSASETAELKSETKEFKSETREPKSETREPKSETREPKSETREHRSETKIRNSSVSRAIHRIRNEKWT